jgi:hypothetical protein
LDRSPVTAISVQFTPRSRIRGEVVGCIGGCNAIDLKNCIWEINKILNLFVPVGGRAAHKCNIIGIAFYQTHRPAGGNGYTIQQDIGGRIAAL